MSSSNTPDGWLPKFYVGYHDTKRIGGVTKDEVDQALECNYNMLTTFITNNHFRTRVHALFSDHMSQETVPTLPPLTDLDTHLGPGDIVGSLVAFTSPWIDLCSPDPLTAGISKQILLMEFGFAAFCGIEHIVVQGPKLSHHDPLRNKHVLTNNLLQFAKVIQECLSIGVRLQVSILLPFSDSQQELDDDASPLGTRESYFEPDLDPREHSADSLAIWEAWNSIRTVCKYHPRLHAALSMPRYLPGAHVQSRWYSEPLKALFFRDTSFLANAHGYPVLQQSVQSFLKDILRTKIAPWIILTDIGDIPAPNSLGESQFADGYLPDEAVLSGRSDTGSSINSQVESIDGLAHLNYLRYVERQQEGPSVIERYGAGYQDYLQTPLQPLTSNLESMTYEVFEKDPVKYDLYEKAIGQALRDWADRGKPKSGPQGKVVVVVAGAGRGPLVARALRASNVQKVPIEMWAIEKNPNAFVYLLQRNRNEWSRQVKIEQTDMRSWKGPWRSDFSPTPAEAVGITATSSQAASSQIHYPVDILISELLGSFGDNELSPECLDGVLHLLAQPHGISIPESYTAWVTPISAPRLHADISQRAVYDSTAPETPAVVWLRQIDYLSRDASYKYKESSSVQTEASDNGSQSVDLKSNGLHTLPLSGSACLQPPPTVLCAWEFSHKPVLASNLDKDGSFKGSLTGRNAHNTRFAKLNFRIRQRGVCHGLGGYFESVLYPGFELSINPNTIDKKSPDMISWFPMFFPLKEPLYVPGTSALDVSIWRQTDGVKVWYEWMVESWGWNLIRSMKDIEASADTKRGATKSNRQMVKLGTTELHSSIKNGCMM